MKDIESWKSQFLRSAEETDWISGERLLALPERSQHSARDYLASERDWNDRSTGFDLLQEPTRPACMAITIWAKCLLRTMGDYWWWISKVSHSGQRMSARRNTPLSRTLQECFVR